MTKQYFHFCYFQNKIWTLEFNQVFECTHGLILSCCCCSAEKPPCPAAVSAQQPAVSGDHHPQHLHASCGCPWLCHYHHHQVAAADQSSGQHRQTEPTTHKHNGTNSANFLLYILTARKSFLTIYSKALLIYSSTYS